MAILRRVLARAGFRLVPNPDPLPEDFIRAYRRDLARIAKNGRGFEVFEMLRYDAGTHPVTGTDFQGAFASTCLKKWQPSSVLDIASHRLLVLGLLAHYDVTAIDVRGRTPMTPNETVVTCDAKKLDLPDASFDAVVTMCAIEHFGLGRYGDPFDIDGDLKAVAEMKRVLKPGGILVFSVPITRGDPAIAFNAHRIYTLEMIESLCDGLELDQSAYYVKRLGELGDYSDVTREPREHDIYCGCWRKPG